MSSPLASLVPPFTASRLVGPALSSILLLTAACSRAEPPPHVAAAKAPTASAFQSPPVHLTQVMPELKVERPLNMVVRPDAPEKVWVISQAGQMFEASLAGSGADGRVLLDLSTRISNTGEMGLLGIALHPRFAENHFVYLNFVDREPLRTTIARFTFENGVLNPASEKLILSQPQPFANHNGGHLVFGPDGYLYIGLGDGGSGGDPLGHGQNTKSLLGKLLRIDVDKPAGDKAYGIPADNPFVNRPDFLPEIYALGLRNPWRYAFDRQTGELWLADVGQNRLEEVNRIRKGQNYGWNIMEGDSCFQGFLCDRMGLTLPVVSYTHDEGVSVTGGTVYRGKAIPSLVGRYLYADFGFSTVWSLSIEEPQPTPVVLLKSEKAVASFAEDAAGELYLLNHAGGIFRLDPGPAPAPSPRKQAPTAP